LRSNIFWERITTCWNSNI